MIDSDVSCGDWLQYNNEQIKHVLDVAGRQGVAGVIEDGNATRPVLDSRGLTEVRLWYASGFNSNVFHGILLSVSSKPDQLEEVVQIVQDYSSEKNKFRNAGVVGLRISQDFLNNPWEVPSLVFIGLAQLDYKGVVSVDYNYSRGSIENFVSGAYGVGFESRLHISPVIDAKSVGAIEGLREKFPGLSCGTTFPYLFLKGDPKTREGLLECLKQGRIDVLASGHDPIEGLPGIAYWDNVLGVLEQRGFSHELIQKITHDNVNRIFGTNIQPLERRAPQLIEGNDRKSYSKDYFAQSLRW